MPADRLIVAFGEEPAHRGLNAEQGEVVAGHHHAAAVDGLPTVGEVGAEGAVGGDAGEDFPGLRRLLQIPEHRVAEDLVAASLVVARLRPRLGARVGEVDQLVRRLHRECPQQHLVEERKDRGVGADAERERDDRDERDERRSEQGAKCQAQVGHGECDVNRALEVYPPANPG